MKFRIYRRGLWFLPQFYDNNCWNFFEKEKIIHNTELLEGIKEFMNCHNKRVRHIDMLFVDINGKKVLVFDDLLTIYTFLGAASYFYSNEKIEFNLNI